MKAAEDGDPNDAVAMKRSVKAINFGGREEKGKAAAEIKRLARGDGRTRRLLAELGVVPPLVAMLADSKDQLLCRRLAIDALLELASGTFRNKKLMVEAGLLSKLPQLMRDKAFAKDQQLARLLFSVSSLVKTQYPLQSSHFLPFLVGILDDDDETTSDEVKLTSVATLYNLSTKLDNTRPIVASGAVRSLLRVLSTSTSRRRSASEGALATLGNLAASTTGRKAVGSDPSAVDALAEILAWDDEPRCQELATYLLMVVAHRSTSTQRERMSSSARSGTIVPRLLELALLGSPLARKRALKLLQWFKDERRSGVGVHSGPQAGISLRSSNPTMTTTGEGEEEDVEEGRRAVKALVKHSLDRNMELIRRRATGLEGSSGLKSLVAASSSKSLPY
ncbi:uncharacterized protein M6B38_207145 [Iris pallida]|uniref:U-box domain-containing protein n=1 Tax=Iris pallida TaxID=29817 RepID=A0AAX6E6E6_IRIPA|nr:uncharacterized protein M6B38_207145 [Iris pallida]